MAQQTPLDLLKESASELVAQNLRSDSAVIARLSDLISAAVERGIAHRAIHEALTAGGLTTSWANYRMAVRRARKAASPAASAASLRVVASSNREPLAAAAVSIAKPALAEPAHERFSVSLPPAKAQELAAQRGSFHAGGVMEALQQAREVAYSKDYAQISRDLYRQAQRDRRNKDRS